jgi:hypothetical protein
MSIITDTVQSFLPPKRKVTPSGWVSFNAVCCHHTGSGHDNRQRGGIIVNGDGVSYHCFNCQFKASWQPGRPITTKFKKLLQWLNVPDDQITKCALDALRLKEDGPNAVHESLIPTFFDKALPKGAEPIANFLDNPPEELLPVVEYLLGRNLYLEDYPFYWTPEDGFNNRFIIPFYYKGNTVGYTARKITEGKPKYISEQQPNYVFNLDNQPWNKKFVIVCEGPMDAICVGGVAVMSSEVGAGQRLLINQLNKEVIVVPDRDHDGPKMIEQAIEFGWSVSFPSWGDGIKDINDSVKKYGRLYTLYTIVKNSVSTELKIRLNAKQWFKEEK